MSPARFPAARADGGGLIADGCADETEAEAAAAAAKAAISGDEDAAEDALELDLTGPVAVSEPLFFALSIDCCGACCDEFLRLTPNMLGADMRREEQTRVGGDDSINDAHCG